VKGYVRFLYTSIASAGIAVLVSFVPMLQTTFAKKQNDLSVFQTLHNKQLQQVNLVDALVRLPLALDIARAQWEDSTLKVDLRYSAEMREPAPFYEDLYELVRFAFEQTTNVQTLRVRMIGNSPQGGNRPVYVTATMKRSDFESNDMKALESLSRSPDDALSAKLHLKFTDIWNRDFGAKPFESPRFRQ